jgi:hypothetical protein
LGIDLRAGNLEMRTFIILLFLLLCGFPRIASAEEISNVSDLAKQLVVPISSNILDIPAPPLIASRDNIEAASLRLVAVVAILVKTQQVTRENLNAAFMSYNNLTTLMGLTDPRQLEYFPKLKSIATELSILRKSLSSG